MTRARAIAGALLGVLLSVPTARAQAQNAVITGKVTSDFGQPLEGANVFITELNISVGSNAQGLYTITIPAARVSGQQVVLRARSLGFVPQTKPMTIRAGAQSADFVLKQDVNRLQEVVVTGVTGATEQKKLPFTVAHIDESEMTVPASNPLSQLQGKVPGAQIVSTSGRPGSAPNVMLRGPKSINGQGRGQEPLYIVDGVVLEGGADNGRSPIADINPQDIESVEVVKGAAASSLYGSRAGNGVIQITTKSGSRGGDGIRFNARSEYGRGDIEHQFAFGTRSAMMMDETKTRFCAKPAAGQPICATTVDLAAEAFRINDGFGDVAGTPVTFQNDFGIAAAPSKQQQRVLFQIEQFPTQYNPVNQLVTPGNTTNNTFDASGRVGKTSFFGSVNNLYNQGAVRYLTGLKRNSLRLNVDQEVGDAWTFGVRTFYARSSLDGGDQENGNGFFRLTRTPAGVNLLALDSHDRLYIRSNPLNQGFQNENPAYGFQNQRQVDQNDRFLGNVTSTFKPFSWLDFSGNVSYDRNNGTSFFQRDKGYRTTGNAPAQPLGFVSLGTNNDQSVNTSLDGAANKSWGDLTTKLTAGYLYEQQDFFSTTQSGNTLAVPGLLTTGSATTGYSIGSTIQGIRSIGMRTGLDVDYKGRYIASLVARRDGSSLFGANNRWADYGRVGLAWRASDEPWWFLPQLNDLKLRAALGTAGGRPRFSGQYETFTIGTGGALSANTLGNKDLRPETTTELEVGFDAEAFSRYGLTVTYAKSDTKDQILLVPPAAISGFNNQWRNAGTLQNKTWEGSLNIPIFRQRNMSWSGRVNLDHTTSVITQLNVPDNFYGTGQQGTETMFRQSTGEHLGTFYGRKFITSCSELPAAFQSQCGAAGSAYQKNDEGLIVWVGSGNSTADGITKNLWQASNAGCLDAAGNPLPVSGGEVGCKTNKGTVNSPWGTQTYWGMPLVVRDSTGSPAKIALGHALPDFRLGVSQNFNYKKFSLYGLVDASVGQSVWNEGRHWALGDFMTAEEDQTGKNLGTAKPLGYYWRTQDAGVGIGGFYDALGPNSRTVEKASYAKIREVNASYNVGSVRGVGDWTVSLIGRNLHTFTSYTGFDPEVGLSSVTGNVAGSSALAAVDAFNFPNIRTFTLSLGTRF
ncbi:MAG: putative outer membrane protein [Gemmatimonadetes bacterium]|nr:putative outer membrane protein [Gemmatimonadota bacterium]